MPHLQQFSLIVMVCRKRRAIAGLAIFLSFIISVTKASMEANAKLSYKQQREMVLQVERKSRIGGDIVLSDREETVNKILMSFKQQEINDSRKPKGKPFISSLHFFKGKHLMEKSEVFKIIRKMPKGGSLHLHTSAMVDIEWLVENVTYMSNCYMCTDCNGQINFHFFLHPPQNPGCPWKLVSEEREAFGNHSLFDQMLYNSMSMVVEDPEKQYTIADHAWQKLEQTLTVARGLIQYAPVHEKYFYEALSQFNADNTQYVEIRGLLSETYDLYGNNNDMMTVMRTYADTFTKFVKDYPEFTGGRIIFSSRRIVNINEMLKNVKTAIHLMKQFPRYVAGFDMVGQEDIGRPLIDYLDALLYPSQLSPPFQLPYFFHAGETDWAGTDTDNNLIDAILLNTSRIGHGYALLKHPEALRMVIQRDIAIEVNPISNQILKLVDDLRNHPAASLIANNVPVVICSDAPSIFGLQGLSSDFYVAFMALAGADADLRLLKQIALNSLRYSSMPAEEKRAAITSWEQKWEQFINNMLHDYSEIA